MVRAVASAFLAVGLVLAGCTTTGLAPTPSGSASGEPGEESPAAPIPADSGWLVTATTTLFTASARLCPGDGFIETPDDPDWAVRTEINGGPPDTWDGATWQIDQGVTINVAAAQYFFHYTSGRDSFQVANGRLEVTYDDAGRPRSGTGTGAMEVIFADGSGEDRVDTTTFTVEPIAAPPWCDA
jgi:hypothetical protein